MRNLIIDRFRRQRPELTFTEAENGEVAPAARSLDSDSETQAQDEQLRPLYADFLVTLSAVDRRVVELRFAQGVPRRQAARRRGSRRLAARRRVRRHVRDGAHGT